MALEPVTPKNDVGSAQEASAALRGLSPRSDPAPARRSRLGQIATALVAVAGVVLIGWLLASGFGRPATDAGQTAQRGLNASGPGDRITSPAVASANPPSAAQTPTGTEVHPSTSVTVDLQPIGQLSADELPITRIVGAPEIVPFPTPFDRSIRLTGGADGLCLEEPEASNSDTPSLAFDLYIDRAFTDGRLLFAFVAVEADRTRGFALEMAKLADLRPNAWYRLTATSIRQAGTLEVTPLGSGRPVLQVPLDSDSTLQASAGEVCIQASLDSSDSLLLDNLEVNR